MDNVAIGKKTGVFLPVGFFSHSIGKKIVVAVTGFAMLTFVIGHMVGNLQVFIGQEQLNKYAAFLQGLGELLWVIRGALALMLILHVWFAVMLKLENWSARPQKYAYNSTVQATFASRTMIWTGLLIASFITYHLMHFTLVSTDPRLADLRHHHDVYSMVILGFQSVPISIAYIIMMFLLAYHLSHGIKSMFQTIGWNNEKYEPGLNKLSYAIAYLLFLGYIAIPAAVLLNVLKLPAGVQP